MGGNNSKKGLARSNTLHSLFGRNSGGNSNASNATQAQTVEDDQPVNLQSRLSLPANENDKQPITRDKDVLTPSSLTYGATYPANDSTIDQRTTSSVEYIDKYQIIQKIGRGNFGEVFLVCQKSLAADGSNAKKYALKKILCKSTKEAQAALKEASILKSLDHPNVIRYQDLIYLPENGETYMCLVMEYVEGCTLTKFLDLYAEDLELFNTEVIMKWFIKFCDALEYIHSKQVIHRDLKPDNIFVFHDKNNDIQLKIADFGVARVLENTTHAQTIAGTPLYMAPEQIATGTYSYKVDIWALGVILFQAALRLKTLKHILASQTGETLQKLISIIEDPSIKCLVAKILKINPEERPTIKDIINSPITSGWLRLLFDKRRPTLEPTSSIAFISGLSSISQEVTLKSLFLLKEEYPIATIQDVIRDHRGIPALINLCGSSVESIRENSLEILFQFVELSRKNQDSMRRWNAIPQLWNLLQAHVSTRLVLRLIISLAKNNTPNQKSFETLGIFPIIKAFLLPQSVQMFPSVVVDMIIAFKSFKDVEKLKPVIPLLAENSYALIRFCYMRDTETLLDLGLIPLLIQAIPKHPQEALNVLRYALEDITFALQATSVHSVCSFACTEYCSYPQEYFVCRTCWKDRSKGCCITCARTCHKGHQLEWAVSESGFYCSCWEQACLARKAKDLRYELLSSKKRNQKEQFFQTVDRESLNQSDTMLLECLTSVQYVSVQLNTQILLPSPPEEDITVDYFEIFIIEGGNTNEIGIGIAPNKFKSTCMPGCDSDSYGYHGDDGRKYEGDVEGTFYGPKFGTNDTMGVGVTSYGQVYFTKNGCFLGVASSVQRRDIPYYFTIGLRGVGIQIKCNYGQEPFQFQFDKLREVKPNLYHTVHNKELQDLIRSSGGIEQIVNLLIDRDDRLTISALTVLISIVYENIYNADLCSLHVADKDLINRLKGSHHNIIQLKTRHLEELLAAPEKVTDPKMVRTPKISKVASKASLLPKKQPLLNWEYNLRDELAQLELAVQLSSMDAQSKQVLTSSLATDISQSTEIVDNTSKLGKPKLRVNVRVLGEERGRVEVCTDTNETFGEFLQRMKKKRPELMAFNLILSDKLHSEFSWTDKIFEVLEDMDTIVLSIK